MSETYSCHNRSKFIDSMDVQDGYQVEHIYIGSGNKLMMPMFVTMPLTNTRNCQYTKSELGSKDRRCEDCKWKQEK